ncbi:MAG: hypothetical protein H6R01_1224 [Burkholderiaceae bacterium]|nr:hypothetical protein [Burkholderiaceae bacterium]
MIAIGLKKVWWMALNYCCVIGLWRGNLTAWLPGYFY